MSTLFGWFFDVYPSGDGMCLWLLDNEGRMHALSEGVKKNIIFPTKLRLKPTSGSG